MKAELINSQEFQAKKFELYPRQWAITKGLISMTYAVSHEDLLQKQFSSRMLRRLNQELELRVLDVRVSKNLGKKWQKSWEQKERDGYKKRF